MRTLIILCLFTQIVYSQNWPIYQKTAEDINSTFGPRYYNGYDFHEGIDIDVTTSESSTTSIFEGVHAHYKLQNALGYIAKITYGDYVEFDVFTDEDALDFEGLVLEANGCSNTYGSMVKIYLDWGKIQ